MKLITGLGNPGEKYQKSRHNVGFLAREIKRTFPFPKEFHGNRLEEESTFMSELAFLKQGSKVLVIFQKPLTYMNNSGQAVSSSKKYGIENLEKKFHSLQKDDLDDFAL